MKSMHLVGVILALLVTTGLVSYVSCGDDAKACFLNQVNGIIRISPSPVIVQNGVQNNVSISCVAGDLYCDSGFQNMQIGVTFKNGTVANRVAMVRSHQTLFVTRAGKSKFIDGKESISTGHPLACNPILTIENPSLRDLSRNWTCTMVYIALGMFTHFYDFTLIPLIPHPQSTTFTVLPKKDLYNYKDIINLTCKVDRMSLNVSNSSVKVAFQYQSSDGWVTIDENDDKQHAGVFLGEAIKDGGFYGRTTTMRLRVSSVRSCNMTFRCLPWFDQVTFDEVTSEVNISILPGTPHCQLAAEPPESKVTALLIGSSVAGIVVFVIVIGVVIMVIRKCQQPASTPAATTTATAPSADADADAPHSPTESEAENQTVVSETSESEMSMSSLTGSEVAGDPEEEQ